MGIVIEGLEGDWPSLKEIVHPQMKILTLFTHPHVVPDLYEILSSGEHKRGSLEKYHQTVDGSHWLS